MICNDPGVKCLCDEKIVRPLASGDNGTAYLLESGQVLKQAFLKPKKKRDNTGKSFEEKKEEFDGETSTGIALGDIGIAPKIHKFWECQGDGYYTMDLLTGVLNEEKFLNGTNGISAQEIQYGIIMALCTMVQNGYAHQDCRFANIGLIDQKVVLFDFGFTKQFNDPNHILDVLVSQLYIVIEQLDDPHFYNNYVYAVIYLIKNGKITSLDQLKLSFDKFQLALQQQTLSLQQQFDVQRKSFLETKYDQIVFIKQVFTNTSNIQDHVSRYCVIQKMLYEYLEPYTIFYDSIIYDCIYDIRQSKSLDTIKEKLSQINKVFTPVANVVFSHGQARSKITNRRKTGGKSQKKQNKKTKKRTRVWRKRH